MVAVLVDKFQLTLGDAEIRKQREALIYLEGQEKYDDLNKNSAEDELEVENTGIYNYLFTYSKAS